MGSLTANKKLVDLDVDSHKYLDIIFKSH